METTQIEEKIKEILKRVINEEEHDKIYDSIDLWITGMSGTEMIDEGVILANFINNIATEIEAGNTSNMDLGYIMMSISPMFRRHLEMREKGEG